MAITHDAISGRSNLYNVDPRQIKVVNGWNPRTDFTGEEELKQSIIENGVLVPLRVKKVDNDILLIDGERRLRATLKAIEEGNNIETVPCMFTRNNISDSEALFLSIITNDGMPLDPIEEAEAFQRLKNWGISVAEIARKVGRSDVFIYKRLMLIDAGKELKEEIKNKGINLAEAEKIIKESKGSLSSQKERVIGKRKSMRIKQIETLLKEKEVLGSQVWEDYADRRYNEGMIDALKMVLGG